MGTIIDGRAVAARAKAEVAAAVARLPEPPGLATVLVGDDPASAVYVAAKHKACAAAGIASVHHQLPATTKQEEVLGLVDELNADPAVSGILCQLPLPSSIDAAVVIERIDPAKDVDGLTTANAGRLALGLDGLRPCTPAGVMELLVAAGQEIRGAHAVVLGRSNLFGKPMAQMLLAADATVTTCHRHTRDLADRCREADILVVAAGRPRLVRANWIKPGATVIDVGINRTETGLVGDVDFETGQHVAGHITPVPGGVGPMTIACLLRNTLNSALARPQAHRSASLPIGL
ncbi:bifunctional methylenetetrahydrofolate dehydrogenase/methenyltetrahydrofolate cyclohydrolase FolD [Streptomyces sp. NPDC002143]